MVSVILCHPLRKAEWSLVCKICHSFVSCRSYSLYLVAVAVVSFCSFSLLVVVVEEIIVSLLEQLKKLQFLYRSSCRNHSFSIGAVLGIIVSLSKQLYELQFHSCSSFRSCNFFSKRDLYQMQEFQFHFCRSFSFTVLRVCWWWKLSARVPLVFLWP